MNVLHVLLEISGTTIPVEIASAIDSLPAAEADVVSERKLPEQLPDTIDPGQIRTDLCGFSDYGTFVDSVCQEYDVIHTHHIGPAARAGFHALSKPIHHVNTQHGHLHYTRAELLKNAPGLVLADTLVYNSHHTADSYGFLEELLKYRANEFVVHNGVDLDKAGTFRADVGSPPTVVTAARLIERKNIDSLIEAIAHEEGISLRVIGDGPQRDALERTAEGAGVSASVEFLGFLPERRDVYRELAAADVFALPTHGEGFCVAVAEAMAVGLPVVVSDLPIFQEVVGPAGVFVDRHDPVAIADALAELRDDPESARERGRRNRRRIVEEFSLTRCAEGYKDVYERVL